MMTMPSELPNTRSPGRTVTPPNCTGACSAPAFSLVQAPMASPRLNTGNRSASIASISRTAPSMMRPATPRARAASVRISPQAPAMR